MSEVPGVTDVLVQQMTEEAQLKDDRPAPGETSSVADADMVRGALLCLPCLPYCILWVARRRRHQIEWLPLEALVQYGRKREGEYLCRLRQCDQGMLATPNALKIELRPLRRLPCPACRLISLRSSRFYFCADIDGQVHGRSVGLLYYLTLLTPSPR